MEKMDLDGDPAQPPIGSFSFLSVQPTMPCPSASDGSSGDSPFPGVEISHLLAGQAKMQSKVNDAISKNVRIECKDPAFAKMLEEELAASDPEKEGQAWAKVCNDMCLYRPFRPLPCFNFSFGYVR